MLFSQAVLSADGPGDTYELITSVLAPGANPVETPDCSHPGFGRHIEEVWDADLGGYVFAFHIHSRITKKESLMGLLKDSKLR